MSYWRLNLRSMTNGLPKHWSISLIWSLITNNTLVPPVPPTKGLPITMYPRAGVPSLPSFCPWVTGYNTSHSEHPSDVLLIATAPTLAQLVFIVSLGLLLLSPQTCDLQLCLLDGFRVIFMNLPVLSLLHLYLHAHSAYWSGLSAWDLILPCSVWGPAVWAWFHFCPPHRPCLHLTTFELISHISGLCTWGSQFFPLHTISIFGSSSW